MAFLLHSGLDSLHSTGVDTSLRGLWSLGFGQVSTTTLVDIGTSLSLASNILLANLPQFILSLLYLSYNTIYTCQLVESEWNEFALRRKPLRVTQPVRGQVSTYYLGLPYSYGVPLLIISILLHWMFSRSIFLVKIKFIDYLGRSGSEMRVPEDITQCGYSPIAIIFSMILACIVLLVGILNGFRRYHTGIPFAGMCSAVISAACHPHLDEVSDAAFEPIQWGVISQHDGIGHCSFSSHAVNLPNTHDVYLGKPSVSVNVSQSIGQFDPISNPQSTKNR